MDFSLCEVWNMKLIFACMYVCVHTGGGEGRRGLIKQRRGFFRKIGVKNPGCMIDVTQKWNFAFCLLLLLLSKKVEAFFLKKTKCERGFR